jgi:hypothetical protein
LSSPVWVPRVVVRVSVTVLDALVSGAVEVWKCGGRLGPDSQLVASGKALAGVADAAALASAGDCELDGPRRGPL